MAKAKPKSAPAAEEIEGPAKGDTVCRGCGVAQEGDPGDVAACTECGFEGELGAARGPE